MVVSDMVKMQSCKRMHVPTCFCKKTPLTGVYEGSCEFLYDRFGGKMGSWWIQQRGALRWAARVALGKHARLQLAKT